MLLRVNKEGSATCKSLNKGDYILVPIVLCLIWVGSILAIQYWQRTNSTVGIHNTHSHYKLSNRIEWHKTNNTLLVDAESAHILKTKSFWYHCVALFAAGPLFSIVFHCFPIIVHHICFWSTDWIVCTLIGEISMSFITKTWYMVVGIPPEWAIFKVYSC